MALKLEIDTDVSDVSSPKNFAENIVKHRSKFDDAFFFGEHKESQQAPAASGDILVKIHIK